MFKNMKIAITSKKHLNKVYKALSDLGYVLGATLDFEDDDDFKNCCSHDTGIYAYYCHELVGDYEEKTLEDLIQMRDAMEQVK